LKGQPAVEADLRTVLGGVYYDLGDYKASEAMHRAALVLRRDLLGHRHPAVARNLVDLGESIRKQDRFADAEPLLTEGLAMQRELLGNDDLAVGQTLYRLGMLHVRMGNGAEAERILREALVIYRNTGDSLAPLDQLALALSHQGKYSEAETIAREAVTLARGHAPSGSPGLAYALFNLGIVLRQQGRQVEAEPLFSESLDIRLKQLPPGHIDTRWSMHNLAESLIASGRSAEAVPHIDELARIAEGKGVMRDHVSRLISARLRHFQNIKDAVGCRTSAEMWERLNRTGNVDLYRAACYRAVTATVIKATDGSPEGAQRAREEADRAMVWLGKAVAAGYADLGNAGQDEDLASLRTREDFQKLLAGHEATGLAGFSKDVEQNPRDPKRYRARGVFFGQSGRLREALADFIKATELEPQNQTNWYEVANLSLATGDIDGYRAACREMLDRFEKSDSPMTAERTAKTCALAPGAVADFARVERVAERCITGTEEHRLRRWFILAKGLTEYRAGHHEQAIEWLQQFAPKPGGVHADATAFAALAMSHHQLRRPKEAHASLDAARAIMAKKRPPVSASPDGWHDWLHSEILFREAEQMLAK
jgi:tetratricopeptide (TPR) repeat protein